MVALPCTDISGRLGVVNNIIFDMDIIFLLFRLSYLYNLLLFRLGLNTSLFFSSNKNNNNILVSGIDLNFPSSQWNVKSSNVT